MPMLRPIQKRFLPDTITIFNQSRVEPDKLLVTVIKFVNYADTNGYNFRQTGAHTGDSFRIVVDMANSAAARPWLKHELWLAANDDSHYTLHAGMWLFNGEHADYADGELVPAKDMRPDVFKAKGLRLLKTKSCDNDGLDAPFQTVLAG